MDYVADPSRCPDCGGQLGVADAVCPSCALPLRGPEAAQLWLVTQQLARLSAQRRNLLTALRSGPATTMPAPPPPAYWPSPYGTTPERPRREWSAKEILLVLGALLLTVAALIFTFVAWGRLGIGGRAAVMVGVTAAAAGAGAWAHRRELPASAETFGALAVLFMLVDAYAVRRAGLFGMDGTDAATYWSVATGVVGGLAAAYAVAVPSRSPRVAAAYLLQLPVVVTAARLGDMTTAGWLLTAQAAALAALTRVGPEGDVRFVADTSSVLTAAVGFGLLFESEALLAGFGVLAAAYAVVWRENARRRVVASAWATLAFCCAVGSLGVDRVDSEQWPLVIAAIGLAAVVAVWLLPRDWRTGPLAVAGGTVAVGAYPVLDEAAQAVFYPSGWTDSLWTLTDNLPARAVLSPVSRWDGTVVVLVVLCATAVAMLLIGELLGSRTPVPLALAAVAVLLVPLGLDWSYAGAIAWEAGVGAIVVVAATMLRRFWLHCLGAAVLAHALLWSLANERATVIVLGVAALVYARAFLAVTAALVAAEVLAVARSVDVPLDRSGYFVVLAAVALLGVRRRDIDVVAVLAYAAGVALTADDPGWLSWALATGGLAALAEALRPAYREAAVVAAGALLVGSSWARLYLEDVQVPEAYATPVAIVALVLGYLRRRVHPETSSWAAYGGGLATGYGTTLVVLLDDRGLTRPLVLGAAALVVLLAGLQWRLQALVVLSALTVALDALSQLAPVAAALPRWVSIAAAGVLVTALGVTYERRAAELRRLRERIEALD